MILSIDGNDHPKETGIIISQGPDGETQVPTFTCAHCGGVRPVYRSGGACTQCRNRKTGFGLLCDQEKCLIACNQQQLRRYYS